MREDAIYFLVEINPKALEVKRAILGCLADQSAYVRVIAASSLHDIDPNNVITVPILVQALESPDLHTRMRSLFELGSMGKKAKAATEAVVRRLTSGESSERESAAMTLGCIGPEARAALPELFQATRDKDRDVRDAAKNAIETIQMREKK